MKNWLKCGSDAMRMWVSAIAEYVSFVSRTYGVYLLLCVLCIVYAVRDRGECECLWFTLRTQIQFACSTILWHYASHLSLSRFLVILMESVGEECARFVHPHQQFKSSYTQQIISHSKSQISFASTATVRLPRCLLNDVTLHGAHNFLLFRAMYDIQF